MSHCEGWRCGDRELPLGGRPLVMGILNVTPDSFSDGGRFASCEAAVSHGLRMREQGADIIDVGGESTRPGSESVDADEETRRVEPVIEALCGRSDAVVSVDTRKAAVARRALQAGARIVNDVSALTHDPDMASVVRDTGAGAVLMHMRGTPRTMQDAPGYGDVVAEVAGHLRRRVAAVVAGGVPSACLAVDPGIGFGKEPAHNLQLLVRLRELGSIGLPVVVGLSRKSFLGKLTGREVQDRLAGSIAALSFCVLNGAHVMRVHDVAASVDAIRVLRALAEGGAGSPLPAGPES